MEMMPELLTMMLSRDYQTVGELVEKVVSVESGVAKHERSQRNQVTPGLRKFRTRRSTQWWLRVECVVGFIAVCLVKVSVDASSVEVWIIKLGTAMLEAQGTVIVVVVLYI